VTIHATGPKKATVTSSSESAMFMPQPKKSAKKLRARIMKLADFSRPTKFVRVVGVDRYIQLIRQSTRHWQLGLLRLPKFCNRLTVLKRTG